MGVYNQSVAPRNGHYYASVLNIGQDRLDAISAFLN